MQGAPREVLEKLMGQQPWKWILKGQFVVQMEQITNTTPCVLYPMHENFLLLIQ